jgi:uncharacterized membrane protein
MTVFTTRIATGRTVTALSLLATSSFLWQSTTTSAFAPSTQFAKHKSAQGLVVKPSHLRLWDNQLQGQQEFEKEGQEYDAAFSKMMMVDASTSSTTTMTTTPILFQWFQKLLLAADDSNNKNNVPNGFTAIKTAALAAMVIALTFNPLPSEAAMSGGRMGGGSFSSAPRMSRPAPSYGGGRGGGGAYYGGARTSYYSRPSVTVLPSMGYGYSPFFAPSPFYGGGVGAISYARGPGLFDLLFLGGFLFVVANFFSNATRSIGSSTSSSTFFSDVGSSALGAGTSVLQLSVAMEVSNRDDPNSILGALRRLANTAKTDSRVGIQNLTSQVAVELLRRKSSIVSASSSYQHFRDRTQAQREYNSKSIQERSKFEKETISKFGGVDYSLMDNSRNSVGGDGTKATMAVITLVLAIDGDSTKIPTRISSIQDVEEALKRIASDAKVDSCLQSAEILWTPEDAYETLTLRDVIADYPELRSL